MSTIQPSSIPASALLSAYSGDVGYADCYFTEVSSPTSLATFVEAFYTTPLFKVERTVLHWFAAKPSSDADARALAKGANTFSAWKVENRTPKELLLVDFTGRTRSWLMAVPLGRPDRKTGTRLYFGSAVVLARPAGGFLRGRLSSNVRPHSRQSLAYQQRQESFRRGLGGNTGKTLSPTMNYTEILVSYLPLFLALAISVVLIRKTGAFEQREHRKRVEDLLERIARAVEKSGK